MAALASKRIAVTYPNGAKVPNEVDLEIAAGEFLAMLAPSGCGKSSLLRLVIAR